LLDTTVRGRTETVSDNLNPVWNEVFYIPVHNTRETLFLQVCDREASTKDKKLGFTELELSKLITKREDGTIEVAEGIDT
jgi:Ca2+-dependent lipid-binding protein